MLGTFNETFGVLLRAYGASQAVGEFTDYLVQQGIMNASTIADAAANGTLNASTPMTMADGTSFTVGNAPEIGTGSFVNTAAGNQTTGILGKGGIFGTGVGVDLSAGAIKAAETVLTSIGGAALNVALQNGDASATTRILANAGYAGAAGLVSSGNWQGTTGGTGDRDSSGNFRYLNGALNPAYNQSRIKTHGL